MKPAQSFLVMLTFIPGRRKGGVHVKVFMTAKGERLGHSSVTSESTYNCRQDWWTQTRGWRGNQGHR